MTRHIYFGETVKGYTIPVLNEREARAGAGLLFMFAMISFLNSYLLHDFTFTKIFVTVFMVDFFIRIFINPKYAPSLILGRIFIQNQTPEYVGAPQKRFAWLIGFTLSVVMFFMIVIFLISENHLSALLLTPLLGSITGFLPFNKYPSKIFLGDSGSLLAGFLLSIFALKTSNKADASAI